MRPDIAPGGTFPDYELPDHSRIPRGLSGLRGDATTSSTIPEREPSSRSATWQARDALTAEVRAALRRLRRSGSRRRA